MIEYVVYEYVDPRDSQPFYVGAGRSGREEWHLKHVRSLMEGKIFHQRTTNHEKVNRISEIISSGSDPVVRILFRGSKQDCFLLEESMISEIGRADLGIGPLLNKRDGGLRGLTQRWSEIARRRKSEAMKGDCNSFFGRKHSAETKEIIRSKRLSRPSPRHSEDHKRHLSERFKLNNPSIRRYRAVDPSGLVYEFEGAPDWCKTMGFPMSTFYGMTNKGRPSPISGLMAGWFVQKVP